MHHLVYGPLNKNIFTHQLELMAKIVLHAPDDIQLIPSSEGLQAHFDQKKINLSPILSKAHYSHLEMDETDSAAFLKHFSLKSGHLTYNTETLPMTSGEKYAISDYTCSGSSSINHFLRHHAEPDYPASRYYGHNLPHYIKSQFTSSVILSSGLNKISTTPEMIPTFRGEHHLTEQDIDERIQKIGHLEDLFESPVFMSSSTSKEVAERFSHNSIDIKATLLVFKDDYGKSIEKLSQFQSEKEYVIIPGQSFVLTEHEIINDKTYFHAEAVEPLIAEKEQFTEEDFQDLVTLVDFAKAKNISTDFISPQFKNLLESPTIIETHNSTAIQHNATSPTPHVPLAPINTVVEMHLPLKTIEVLTVFG